jgi:hypothetical protein
MSLTWYGLWFAGGMFLGMLLLLETGRFIGLRRFAQDPEGARHRIGVVEGAVFGLLGLLIAFTFSGAVTRFDTRRQLIVEEAASVQNVWQHLDLFAPKQKSNLQELVRQYLDSRLGTYQKLPDLPAAKVQLARSVELQGEIWSNAITLYRDKESQPSCTLLLPALDQMFEIATKRIQATKAHQPVVVFAVLAVVSLTASLLAGYGMAGGKQRSWVHMIGFATVVAMTIYVILEFEFPRLGFINLHAADSVLIELRGNMR